MDFSLEIIHIDPSVYSNIDPVDDDPILFGEDLPRNNIRMMLEEGEEDMIPRFQVP